MNQKSNTSLLPCIILGMGCASSAVRALIYAVATDSEGLVDIPTFPALLVLAITTVAIYLCIAHTHGFSQPDRYACAVPPSRIGAIATCLPALGIVTLLLTERAPNGDVLALIRFLLGGVSIVCFLILGAQRMRGKTPHFALYALICLFFIAHLVNAYRVWSANTQTSTFVWQLFASIALMLSAYAHALLASGGKGGRRTIVYGLWAMYFALLCLPDECCKLFYITCGLWALTSICAPAPKEDAHAAS